MIRVSIQFAGVEKFAGQFETEADADSWIAQQELNASWGDKELWALDTNDAPANAARRQHLNELGQFVTEYKVGDAYQIVKSDVSAQVEEQDKINMGLRAQEFGSRVVALVYAINDAKNLSIPQLQAMMADQTLAIAERLLKNGAIVTARAVIAGMTPGAFTADDIARVLAFIDASDFAS